VRPAGAAKQFAVGTTLAILIRAAVLACRVHGHIRQGRVRGSRTSSAMS